MSTFTEVMENNGISAETALYRHPTARIFKGCFIEDPIKLCSYVMLHSGSRIGRYTHIGDYSVITQHVEMGRYCALGSNVFVGSGSHPTDWLSIHPFQYSARPFNQNEDYLKFRKLTYSPFSETNFPWVKVGNDVWIGTNTVIKRGLTIGDGAIIGAGSVVTKDVPPYAIVGGVPAKLIRYRFSETVIERLMKVQWWDMTVDQLKNIPFDDIERALEALEAIRADNLPKTSKIGWLTGKRAQKA